MDPVLLEAFGLDPDVLHLNHGAFGVAPVAVRQAAAAWRDRGERNPHRFNRVEWGLEDGYAESFDYPGTWDSAGWLAVPDGLAYYDRLASAVGELLRG